jgi:hypothetical protein
MSRGMLVGVLTERRRCQVAEVAQKARILREEAGPMPVKCLDHVQLAMPPGREEEARAFYGGVLGISDVPKPPHLAKRGGCWFEQDALKVHLGLEADFKPARKVHPAFIVSDLGELVARLEIRGYRVVEDEPLEGYNRRYVDDPFHGWSSVNKFASEGRRNMQRC